jgi:hypothetical protein
MTKSKASRTRQSLPEAKPVSLQKLEGWSSESMGAYQCPEVSSRLEKMMLATGVPLVCPDNFRMNTGMVDMAPLIIWLL